LNFGNGSPLYEVEVLGFELTDNASVAGSLSDFS